MIVWKFLNNYERITRRPIALARVPLPGNREVVTFANPSWDFNRKHCLLLHTPIALTDRTPLTDGLSCPLARGAYRYIDKLPKTHRANLPNLAGSMTCLADLDQRSNFCAGTRAGGT